MKNRLIVFATEMEARASLSALKARKSIKPHLYLFDGGQIVITGMGIAKASATVALHAAGIDEIWNFGIAGTLQDSLPLGTTYHISTVSKHLSLPALADAHTANIASLAYPVLNLAETGYRLLSSDFPIHHEDLRHRLAADADLIDMEGYGVATAAAHAQIPCKLYKVVSDFAKINGQHLIKAKLAELSDTIAVFLTSCLNR